VADHTTAHERIYLRTLVGVTETIITSTDDPADGFYDDLAAYLPSLTCGGCHAGIAENHWGNFHSGLRVADLFDSGGNPLPRGAIDPARPWITGPGMVGNWCATYNRQLPDLTAAFVDAAEFIAKVDMGMFEFIRECGSCHVGGGPGVENPFGFSGYTSDALDDPVRAAALDGGTVPLNAWDFYVAADGSVTRGNWADAGILDVDCLICHLDGYDHLTRNNLIRGAARFGQAASVGAGLATPDELSPDKLDYNTLMVSRDASNQLYLSHNLTFRIAGAPPQNNCMACHLPSMVVNENQVEKPDQWQKNFYTALALPSLDPENSDPLLAANRKSALYRNDMLKRGATWRRDEVHKFMECTGCHSRTSKTQAYNPVSASETYLHSPGKGYDPLKYPSPVDGTVKLCEDCHVDYGDLNNDGIRDTLAFAPPEMKVYHAQAGLLAKIVPSARRVADAAGSEEAFVGSHIDIISCVACHVKKRYAAARSVDYATGVGYYNLVGALLDQVPGSQEVELAYSWRDNGGSKVINGQPNPDWRRQIFPFNYLTSSSWDDTGGLDANGDGFNIGELNGLTVVVGDPIFQRTVKDRFAFDYINADNNRVASGLSSGGVFGERGGWSVAGLDGHVLFTQGAEIDAFQVAMATSGYVPRLTLEAQPFLVTHNVMPIRNVGAGSGWETFALGAPQRDTLGKVVSYGCGDCHGGSGGLFNGNINMLGKGRLISDDSEIPLTVSWNQVGDVKALARAWNREGTVQEIDFSGGNQTRDPERREFLGYDVARQAFLNNIVPADYGFGVDPVADIASINGISADSLPPDEVDWAKATSGPIAIDLDSTVDLVAASAGTAGTFQYRWNINDEPGTLAGSTVEKSFKQPGLWTVLLTVIDEEGRLSQNLQKVNVVLPAAGTQISVTTTAANPTVHLLLSSLPPHDQIKFYFGDGTRLYVDSDTANYAFNRDYRLRDTYFKLYDPDTGQRYDPLNDPTPGNEYEAWVYKTSVRLYQGLTWVETVNIQVIIPVL
jgi:mono/diheme cytochrome c family protein